MVDTPCLPTPPRRSMLSFHDPHAFKSPAAPTLPPRPAESPEWGGANPRKLLVKGMWCGEPGVSGNVYSGTMNAIQFFVGLLISCASVLAESDYSREEIEESESNLEKWKSFASRIDGVTGQAHLGKLCLGLRATADPSVFPFGDRIGAHNAIKNSLLGISGYGQFWRTSLEKAWQQVQSARNASERGPAMASFNNVQVAMCKTLSELPSSESVRALGEFLDDRDDRGPMPPGPPEKLRSGDHDEQRIQANSLYAVRAFAKLPFVSPPVPQRKLNAVLYEEDRGAWRLWYEQVKSGNRTFRFKGDPREYNLDGPVP